MNELMTLREIFSKALDNIAQESALQAVPNFSEELNDFKQRINDNFFRLVVIGEFSSGKSTFINALIGKDILSHATKETTAVLTRIINVAENDSRKGSAVAFLKTGEQLPIKNLEDLKEYTTAVSTKYQVAREIEIVEIYMPLMKTSRPLMIMDTPGLNGIAEGHLKQTQEIVKKAHACIYLIQQRGLTKDDLEFLKEYLAPCQQRFIFVQNFIDEFNSMEGERVEDRIAALQKILTEKVFGDSSEHEFFICGISALKELAARDSSLKRLYATDTEDLTDADREKLSTESGFEDFRKILEENFSADNLDEIQYRATAFAILNWVKGIIQKISGRLEEDTAIYNTSREKNAADRVEHLIKRIQERRESNLTAIRGLIAGEIRKLDKELEKILDDDVQGIENKLAQEINDCTTPEDVERKRGELPKKIHRELESLGGKAIDYCKVSFQGLHQLIMQRVEEYSGIRSINDVGGNFMPDALPAQQQQFSSESDIARDNYRLNQKRQELYGARDDLRNANSNVQSAEKNFQSANYEVQSAQQRITQKQNEIRSMGTRPAERVWYEDVPVERGGIFGFIADIFTTKTESKEFRDDSAGEAWDESRRQLQNQQNSLTSQRDEYIKKKDAAEKILTRYRQNAADNARKISRLEDDIRNLEAQIRADNERLDKEKTIAKRQFVINAKNKLRGDVTKYLRGDNGAMQNLLEELRKRTAAGERKIFSDAESNFNRSIEQKLSELENVKQGKVSPLQKKIKGLEQSQKTLEYYSKKMEERLA